jgi:hypothetical protein
MKFVVKMENGRGLVEYFETLSVRVQAATKADARKFDSQDAALEKARFCERQASCFSEAYHDGGKWTLTATVEPADEEALDAGRDEDYVDFGDVARSRLGMQCQYASRYVGGLCDYQNLTSDPALGRTLRFLERSRPVSSADDYHSLRIHRDDVEEFVARVERVRQRRF